MLDNPQPRRTFLVQGAALVAGGPLFARAAAAQQLAANAAPRAGADYIDAHVHVWTDDLERYPPSDGFTREQMQPRTFTPEELQNHCRPCGVRRVVLIQMSYYGFDNRYMLDVIAKYPGVYAGVAVIDADAVDVAEQMRRLYDQKVSGFRLHTVAHHGQELEHWLMRPGIQTMWKTCADTGQAICLLMNPDALPWVDALCERYPKTRVVIDHMARIGVDGVIRPDDVEQLKRCARHENTFVKVSAFYALGKKSAPYEDLAPLIRELVGAYGAQRLMWASDCPFQVQEGHRYADSIDLIRQRLEFLTDDDRAWMLSKTAAQVYFDSLG